MASFNFITDEDFRLSLENDFREMNLCIQAGAHKSAVVIAGSIIEAVLIDYVISEEIIGREEALKLDFGKVLSICKDKKIITGRSLDLSSVVKSYRNLIHPGRAIRLQESIDKETADVAKALVSIVLNDVEKQKKESYGYTAEQIVSKLEVDPSATSIVSHLLSKVNTTETERLLLKILPAHYLSNSQSIDHSNLIDNALKTCYRIAFEKSNEEIKRKAAVWLVKVFSEGDNQAISSFGIAFLRASDLIYVSQSEASLVKYYLLGKLKEDITESILEAIKGIGKFIEIFDVLNYVDPLIKSICQNWDLEISKKSQDYLQSEIYSDEIEIEIKQRINIWISFYEEKLQNDYAERLKEVITNIDLPF